MSRNDYSETNLHIVWHTKQSYPFLKPDLERRVHQYLRERVVNEPGAFLHEIGGTENHVHLCLTVPPTLLISDSWGSSKEGVLTR